MSKINGVSIPGTLERSPKKAQRTYAKAMASAEEQYGSGQRAGRVAYAAVKHEYEKVGDHWEKKSDSGPSDSRSRQASGAKRRGRGTTHGGVDVEYNSRQDLYARAKSLGVEGRSTMSKQQLADAIAQRQG